MRSLTARLFFSHVLVAVLTGIIVTALILIVVWVSTDRLSIDDYKSVAIIYAASWLFNSPDGQPNTPDFAMMPGFTLVVAPDDTVRWSHGDTGCRAGKSLSDCAPDLVGLKPSEREFSRDGQRWVEVVIDTIQGDRVISQRGPTSAQPSLITGDFVVYGYRDMMLFEILSKGALAIPVALVLAWLIARPQTRRIGAISRVSQRFAQGDLRARVDDSRPDEIGQLSQQFDTMAATLESNIDSLRDLAQRNADLAQRAEQSAIQAERARLSRDLHDAIAQRLFSLSVSTATLPDIIAADRERGIIQAQSVASLAERTLLDLRALLLDLRPSNIMQHGLADALQTLCAEWQAAQNVPAACTLMLNGSHIPAAVEDALYRVTQEALSNAARHARAASVQVTVVEGQRQIILSVTDDGTGFDTTSAAANGKFGLTTMRERARSLGGALSIESDPARGTTVQMTLPLRNGE